IRVRATYRAKVTPCRFWNPCDRVHPPYSQCEGGGAVLDGASTVPTAYDQAVSLMIQNVRIATCRKRQSYDFPWLRPGYMMQFQEIEPAVLREVSQRTLDLRVAHADGRLQVLGHLQVFFEQEPMMGIFPLRAGHSNLWVRFPRLVTSRAILSHK